MPRPTVDYALYPKAAASKPMGLFQMFHFFETIFFIDLKHLGLFETYREVKDNRINTYLWAKKGRKCCDEAQMYQVLSFLTYLFYNFYFERKSVRDLFERAFLSFSTFFEGHCCPEVVVNLFTHIFECLLPIPLLINA